jgi:hypothetical protein
MENYVIIGIDFSSNSIGLSFLTENYFNTISVLNRYELSSSKEFNEKDFYEKNDFYRELNKFLKINIFNRRPLTKPQKNKKSPWDQLTIWHKEHSEQCLELSNFIYESIEKEIDEMLSLKIINSETKIFVSLEHYDTGLRGKTDNIIQMVEFTTYLKNNLFRKLIKQENFYIFTAPEVKMFAGKGNFEKEDMYKAIIEYKDTRLSKNNYIKWLRLKNINHISSIRKKKGKEYRLFKKPIDDINDSVFLSLLLEDKLKNINL